MDAWVAVCRELLNNRLIAVGFVNNHNKRIRVPVESLEKFFSFNKVLNVTFNVITNDIESYIININSLGTYRYTPSGRCTFIPGIDETEILKRFKLENNSTDIDDRVKEVDDSIDKLKSKVKITAANSIISATAIGIKAINKNINDLSTKDIKKTILGKLKKYSKILDKIVAIKQNTNKTIYNNKNIVEYSRELECKLLGKSNLRQDILNYGIPTYVRNIQTLIKLCLEPIIKYELMDTSLKDLGTETTFRVYSTSLNNKILRIKSMHLETKQLIQENRSLIGVLEVDDIQQKLVEEIELMLNSLENNIKLHRDIKQSKLALIRSKIGSITNTELKNEYYDYLYSLEHMSIPIENNNIQRENIAKQLDDIKVLIQDTSLCSTEELLGIAQLITSELEKIIKDAQNLGEAEKEDIQRTVNELKNKLQVQ